jgi:hypothetical protein
VVDDAYFSALLGAAKADARTSIEAAERTLARYKTVLPDGRHSRTPRCGLSACGRAGGYARVNVRALSGELEQW